MKLDKILSDEKPIVLTIAGFDPSSGAGLTADIRTFENIGVYGMSVCTAITIQDAKEVKEWVSLDLDSIKKQLDIIVTSYDIKVVKTGMLGTIEVIELVAEYTKKYEFDLIVDPVIISGSGKRLADEGYEKAIQEKLFPLAKIVTFNKDEAELFSGMEITDAFSLQNICEVLSKLGIENVIVKGGHIDEGKRNVVDYLYNDLFFRFYPRERIAIGKDEHIHGTGCIFSSLIAGFSALGYEEEESLIFSEDFMERIFRKKFPLKRGKVLDTGYSEKEIDVLLAVQKVADFICGNPKFTKFIPEVKMNIAISHCDAKDLNDVAAIEGRITIVGGIPVASGPIKFGVSNHTGRLILEAKKFDKSINVVINLKFQYETILKLAEYENISMMDVNRLKQSSEMALKENSTMTWIVQQTYERMNKIPTIIWDRGEPEKEPMIRLFANDAEDAIKKLTLLINLD